MFEKNLKIPRDIGLPRVQPVNPSRKPHTPAPRVNKTSDALNEDFNKLLQQQLKVPPRTRPFPQINLSDQDTTQLHPKWVVNHIFDEQGKKQSLDDHQPAFGNKQSQMS